MFRKMQRTLISFLLALVFFSGPAVAQPGAQAQVEVNLVIEEYCSINLFYPITISLQNGVSSGHGETLYDAFANFSAVLTPHLDIMPGTPGNWSSLIEGQPSIWFGPGSSSGIVDVFVADVPPNQQAGYYPAGYLILDLTAGPEGSGKISQVIAK